MRSHLFFIMMSSILESSRSQLEMPNQPPSSFGVMNRPPLPVMPLQRGLEGEEIIKINCAEDEKRKVPLAFENMEIQETIKSWGYPLEELKVSTEDGYILTIFRISGSASSPPQPGKIPVLLWHGLMSNAFSWLFLAENSLALKLADEGFDVFLGNSRGNHYSIEHEEITENSEKYWDFSLYELSFYDIPNTIDKILQVTSQKSLYYIGHSLSTVMYSIAVTMRPHTADKIRAGFLLSPGLHMSNAKSLGWIDLMNAFAVQPNDTTLTKIDLTRLNSLLDASCIDPRYRCNNNVCEYLPFHLYGHSMQPEPSLRRFFAKRYFDSTSSKVFQHLVQMFKTGEFRQFEYEKEKNLKLYKSERPALYELWNITCPTVFFWGQGDLVNTPLDVDITAMLWNKESLTENRRAVRDSFSHLDFLLSNDAQKAVYDRLIFMMKSGQYAELRPSKTII